jgi:hypothetical protein
MSFLRENNCDVGYIRVFRYINSTEHTFETDDEGAKR